MKEKCIIVGAGTYGQTYAQYLRAEYNIIGFVDDNKDLHTKLVANVRVLGDMSYLLNNIDRSNNIIVPIGNNRVRTSILKTLQAAGFKTPSYINPQTNIHESVLIGKCVYILPGTCIMPLAVINDYSLISMGVNIAHHTIVGEGSFLSQGTNIGAGILLKKFVFCGIGSTVMTGVSEIGEEALIGAAATVIKNVPPRAVVVGSPAKIIKYIEAV